MATSADRGHIPVSCPWSVMLPYCRNAFTVFSIHHILIVAESALLCSVLRITIVFAACSINRKAIFDVHCSMVGAFLQSGNGLSRTCGNNSVVRMTNNIQKESAQDNGGAEYSLADTFGLYRAGRFVREDAVNSEG